MVVVAKLTYAVSASGEVSLAARPSPIRGADVPVSDQLERVGVLYPGDLVDEKPGTDVLMIGTAHPPAGKPVPAFDVSLRIEAAGASIKKSVRVHGPRVWAAGLLGIARSGGAGATDAARLRALVRRLRRGPARRRGSPHPAGIGFALDRARLVGSPAPEIEDPLASLASRSPAAAGFGPIAMSWSPRAERAGTYDRAWARERAPLRPIDFDPRHGSCAPADLWSEEPLVGDEPVELLGVLAQGAWRFRLPRYGPRFESVIRGVKEPLSTHLDTFLVDLDARQVELTWRASVPLPKKSEHLEKLRIFETQALPAPMLAAIMAARRAEIGRPHESAPSVSASKWASNSPSRWSPARSSRR